MTAIHRRVSRVLLAALLVSLPACSTSGLSFTQDKRVEIVSPANHSEQRLPITVRWTVKDFQVTGPDGRAVPEAGYFAVFLDRAPQPPGHGISSLAKDDRRCVRRNGCPDAKWFSDHHIYPTTAREFVIDALPIFTKEERDRFHEVTVVLLDGAGNRIGESAFSVEFKAVGRA